MQEPRAYIEEIKNRQINSDEEFVLDSLSGAIDRLGKAFPRYGSFLMEFVQNADDAKSRSLRIELLENAIKISNDGRVFSKEDVRSICKVGRSSKTPEDYIGYLGVGFKAVFLISECPEIHSDGYHFKFDRSFWQDADHTPWQVIPLWIEDVNPELAGHETVFILPLKVVSLRERIGEEIKPDHLNSRILLFLRYLTKIEMTDAIQGLRREIVKSELPGTPNYQIVEISEYNNDTLSSQDLWLLFRSVCHVPGEIKSDYVTKEWERERVEKREILVAFKLDDEKRLVRERRGTAHIGVFSFLPLKEIPSGLNFLLQGDFLTAPGRGELTRECLWNNWLAGGIYELIVEKCIPTFLSSDQWKMNFTDIVFSREGGHKLFEESIKIPLNEYLENSAVLIAEDGTPSRAEELVLVHEEIRGLLSDTDLEALYPGRKVLHRDCKPHPGLQIKESRSDIDSFIRGPESPELLKKKAEERDIEWFKRLYSMYVNKYNYSYFRRRYSHYNVAHDEFWNSMCNLQRPIILTDDYHVAKVGECYINPANISIPEKLKEKFKIVNLALAKDEGFETFRRQLNEVRHHDTEPIKKVIRELNNEDITDALRRQEALELTPKQWEKLSDEERIEKIKEIRNMWGDYSISLEDYDFLTLLSKSGKWAEPDQFVLPREYRPEHNIESLIQKELLDVRLEFVSDTFIEGVDDDEIRKWRRFFQELGVDKVVRDAKEAGGRKGGIVHRIGVLTALLFETKRERFPRELGESERRGYDIESKTDTEERYIEVKGTSYPTYDIFLTVNEFRACREKKDRYFVYVVTDALRDPVLHIAQGDRLLDITDTKIIIPFRKWLDEAKDEEFQP